MINNKNKRRREKFLAEEDVKLKQLVKTYGNNSWETIAEHMPGRNPRQCRERWKHYLSSARGKAPWTPEEDQLLYEKMEEFGPKWTKIATFFNDRTDIQVKTRWMQRFASFSNLHLKNRAKNRPIIIPSQPLVPLQGIQMIQPTQAVKAIQQQIYQQQPIQIVQPLQQVQPFQISQPIQQQPIQQQTVQQPIQQPTVQQQPIQQQTVQQPAVQQPIQQQTVQQQPIQQQTVQQQAVQQPIQQQTVQQQPIQQQTVQQPAVQAPVVQNAQQQVQQAQPHQKVVHIAQPPQNTQQSKPTMIQIDNNMFQLLNRPPSRMATPSIEEEFSLYSNNADFSIGSQSFWEIYSSSF